MATEVKDSRTRISSKHQVTIGKEPFREAGFKVGDTLIVRATGPGRIEMTSLEALIAKHREAFKDVDGVAWQREIEEMRRTEWP
jgi:bifunctional DNA-binding transcriptional regulator/antitoxin component of YhaV-PrlF toxin-antitoxin module